MTARRALTWLGCLGLALAFRPVFVGAAAFDAKGIGARAAALGGAFTAGTNDASSYFWNPAALTTVESKEFAFTYEDLYTKGLVSFSNIALAYPEVGPGGFGVAWTRMGVSNKVPFDYSENTYTFAYGGKITEKISLGGGLNYFKLNSTVKGGGFGVDGGLLYRVTANVALGASYKNIGRTGIRYDTGAVDPLRDNLRVGARLSHKSVNTYFDLDNVDGKKPLPHLGLEAYFYDEAFAVRGGLSRRTADGFNWVYAIGFGIKARFLLIDYAFENHFDAGPTHVVSVKWRF